MKTDDRKSNRSVYPTSETLPQKSYEEILAECKGLRQRDPEKVVSTIDSLLPSLRRIDSPPLLVKGLCLYAEACDYLGMYDKVLAAMDEALTLEGRLSDPRLKAIYLGNCSMFYLRPYNYDPALAFEYNSRAYRHELQGDRSGLSLSLIRFGNIMILAGQYDKALQYNLEALAADRWRNDAHPELVAEHIAGTLATIGIIYSRIGDREKARDYFERSIERRRAQGKSIALADALNRLATLCIADDLMEEANACLNEALALCDGIGATPVSLSIMISRSDYHWKRDEAPEALQCAERALSLSHEIGNPHLYLSALIALGKIYAAQHRLSEGIETFQRAKDLAGEFNLPENLMAVYDGLADLYSRIGDTENAFDCLRMYRQLHDEIAGAERLRNIARIEHRQALQEVETRHESLLFQTEEARKEARLLNREVQEARLLLMRHTEFLRKLRYILTPHATNGTGKIREIATKIMRNIDGTDVDLEEMQIFEFEFEQAHREFTQRLARISPRLTPTEIRICILTRLGLPIKQIAELMFISTETVKTHRKHIRRKLPLPAGTNLTSFLLGIE